MVFKKGHKINLGKKRLDVSKRMKGNKINLGRKPWNTRLTKETDERVRKYGKKGSKTIKRLFREGKIKLPKTAFKKGQHYSPKNEFKKGNIPWNKNKKGLQVAYNKNKTYEELYSEEKGKEIKKKITRKGTKASEKTKKKMSEQRKGEKHWNWKGGITPIIRRIRNSIKLKEWQKAIFKRDDYICQNSNCKFCHNKKGGRLHAHHIKPFSKYPKLRFDINNGITLCEKFHKKIRGKEEKYIKTFQNKIENIK